MKEVTTHDGVERFRTGAAEYAAYLETFEGRLRIDLAFANLQDFLPRTVRPRQALDVGGGTGTTAVRLAQLGIHVTVLDESPSMLELARHAATEAAVAQMITLKLGDATRLADLSSAESFDVILFHNVLEFVDDPCGVLRSAACLLRDTSSIISVLVRNQAGEVLKSALLKGDLVAADQGLTAEWGDESLYGGRVRLFTTQSLQALFRESSLAVDAECGVRIIADFLPPIISRDSHYERIFELERKLGSRPEFAEVARYTQFLGHRAAMKDVP